MGWAYAFAAAGLSNDHLGVLMPVGDTVPPETAEVIGCSAEVELFLMGGTGQVSQEVAMELDEIIADC